MFPITGPTDVLQLSRFSADKVEARELGHEFPEASEPRNDECGACFWTTREIRHHQKPVRRESLAAIPQRTHQISSEL